MFPSTYVLWSPCSLVPVLASAYVPWYLFFLRVKDSGVEGPIPMSLLVFFSCTSHRQTGHGQGWFYFHIGMRLIKGSWISFVSAVVTKAMIARRQWDIPLKPVCCRTVMMNPWCNHVWDMMMTASARQLQPALGGRGLISVMLQKMISYNKIKCLVIKGRPHKNQNELYLYVYIHAWTGGAGLLWGQRSADAPTFGLWFWNDWWMSQNRIPGVKQLNCTELLLVLMNTNRISTVWINPKRPTDTFMSVS